MHKPALQLIPILLLSLLGLAPCNADVWTSVKGEVLEGRFIRYNAGEETITIERSYDRRVFAIPESQLITADRLRAVRLENGNAPDYWYTDYAEAKAQNPDKRCLYLYRNGADPEAFRLFYTKLLLRDAFKRTLQRKQMVVCVQEEGEVPQDLEYGKISEYFTHRNSMKPNETEWRYEKEFEDPKVPLAIYADFSGKPVPRIKKRGPHHWSKHWYPLYAPTADLNPFQHNFIAGTFIDFKEIEKQVEAYR